MPSILIVGTSDEDDRLLRDLLPLPGWATRCVKTCMEAVALLRCAEYPVILCECRLSDGCWKDILRALEARATILKPPSLIVISRLADERLWAEVLNLGGYDVLLKPLDGAEVSRVLASAARSAGA